MLQEQSRLVGVLPLRAFIEPLDPMLVEAANTSLAACAAIATQAAFLGVRHLLVLQTWGWRDGDVATLNTFGTFEAMSDVMARGNSMIMKEARAAATRAAREAASLAATTRSMEVTGRMEDAINRLASRMIVRVAPVGTAFLGIWLAAVRFSSATHNQRVGCSGSCPRPLTDLILGRHALCCDVMRDEKQPTPRRASHHKRRERLPGASHDSHSRDSITLS